MNKNPNPINRSATVGCGAQLIRQYPRGNLSVLALLIFGILGSPCASAAFTPEVIGEEVTGESLKLGETQNIRTEGIASDTTINSRGRQYIFDGGTANNTTINSGGEQYIDGGIANNTTINAGMQSISSGGIGGTTNGTIVNGTLEGRDQGNAITFIDGGIGNNITINGYGYLYIIAPGKLTGQTIFNNLGAIYSSYILNNEGEVIFQRSADYILDFDLTGTGGLTQNGPHTLTLSTASSYSGATTVNGGIIKAGADNVFSASSDYITQAGGSLDLDGYHQTFQSLNNGGTVNFGGIGGNTLTITGDYTGNNGLLNMNSVLEDDNSVTDKLIIAGNTAGNTFVQINNLGGSGAQTLNGIELITVGGVSDGEFTQQGRIVAGAYDYYLQRGVSSNNANWYLSNSIPTEIPEVPGVPGPSAPEVPVPPITERPETPPPLVERPEASGYSANLAAANNLFVTRLHDRLGETQYIDALTGEQKVTSLWLRNEGGH
ncbi:autotransporter outer membrane beta-barrel domain-containing protein, partial [Yersinia frederiksenii]|uniref:autotransporter outer membrane beta-barrel domain-containing protein n=1 Tax=Yersinia frederiksenii TaxID=29484 RepID=UPI0025AB2F72